VTAVAQAHLSAVVALTARPLGGAQLSATPLVIAHSVLTAHGASALSAGALLTAIMDQRVNPEDLWKAYLAAAKESAAAWEQWRMMRQAGGTDGSAGFLFGQAYEAQRTAEAAYEAWRVAQAAARPGVTG
jgi:hypothetical protein